MDLGGTIDYRKLPTMPPLPKPVSMSEADKAVLVRLLRQATRDEVSAALMEARPGDFVTALELFLKISEEAAGAGTKKPRPGKEAFVPGKEDIVPVF